MASEALVPAVTVCQFTSHHTQLIPLSMYHYLYHCDLNTIVTCRTCQFYSNIVLWAKCIISILSIQSLAVSFHFITPKAAVFVFIYVQPPNVSSPNTHLYYNSLSAKMWLLVENLPFMLLLIVKAHSQTVYMHPKIITSYYFILMRIFYSYFWTVA